MWLEIRELCGVISEMSELTRRISIKTVPRNLKGVIVANRRTARGQ
jgi:hypothetical protein